MTVKQLFDFIKGVRPGFAFTDAQLTVWLNEIEGHVQTDIWLLEPAVDETQTGLVEYDSTIDPETGEMVDANHELLVPFPWNKLYRYFLLMSIDLANGEYQRYANSYELFNEAYEEYAGWYAQHVSPANGEAITRGYYISAYQFAARGGYTGTEEEFTELIGGINGIVSQAEANSIAASEDATAAYEYKEAALAAKTAAELAQDMAYQAEEDAKNWAVGSATGIPSETNNAKYYADQARAHYGAPLTVSTAESFETADTSRVYVYVGDTTASYINGNWYYYNGSSWTSGGVYNSTAFATDETLTQFGMAADAKVTGDALQVFDENAYPTSQTASGSVAEFANAVGDVKYNSYQVSLPYSSTPYTSIIVRNSGRNVWGGDAAYNDFVHSMPSATKNPTQKTVTFRGTTSFSPYGYPAFKENTQYTIILTLQNSSNTTSTNLRVVYKHQDGSTSYSNLTKTTSTEKQTIRYVTGVGKTLLYVGKVNQVPNTTTLYMNECGAFEGNVTAFSEFDGATYTYEWPEYQTPVYGGTVDCVNCKLTAGYDESGNIIENQDSINITGTPIKSVWGYNVTACQEGNVEASCFIPAYDLANTVRTLAQTKQDLMTFDQTPTEDSTNPVTSGGIFNYVSDLETIFTGNVDTAVSNWLDDHPEAVTTVLDNSLSHAKFNADAKAWIRSGVVNVKDYGAVGDGETDDSTAILTAIAALPASYGVLYFPPGLYIHGDGLAGENGTGNDYDGDPNVGRDIRLMFSGMSNLTIIGDSAEIRSNDGNGECPHNAIFNFYSCSHVTLSGITINGRREERGLHMSDGNAYNRRGNIHIYGCDDVHINNVRSINSAMDGAYIGKNNGNRTTNLFIRDCDFRNAHRNGLSVGCATHVLVDNVIFDNAGTSGPTWSGTNPKSGVDVEADYGEASPNVDVVITNCQANNCAGTAAFFITRDAKFVTLERCACDNNINVSRTRTEGIRILKNRVTNAQISMPAGGEVIGNTVVLDASTLVNGHTYNAIVCDADTDDILAVEGNTFQSVAENFPENVFSNYGLVINNSHAVFSNNVFQDPLWSISTSPVVINAMSVSNNVIWQKTIPNGYKRISE